MYNILNEILGQNQKNFLWLYFIHVYIQFLSFGLSSCKNHKTLLILVDASKSL